MHVCISVYLPICASFQVVSPQPKPGEQLLFLPGARPLCLAPSGHLWLDSCHGLLDFSAQDCLTQSSLAVELLVTSWEESEAQGSHLSG